MYSVVSKITTACKTVAGSSESYSQLNTEVWKCSRPCCAVYQPHNINSLQRHRLRGLKLKAEAWHIHRSQRFQQRRRTSKMFSSLLCCYPNWPKENSSLKGLGKENWNMHKEFTTLLVNYPAIMNHPAQNLL